MPKPGITEQYRRLLSAMGEDELRELARWQRDLEEISEKIGPQTKEELWQWFKEKVGIELGRVSVCPGHSSQIDILWEIYSFQVTRVLLVLSRGGGKTSSMAWLDDCQAEHYPGFQSFTIGPGRSQGQRKYDHLLPLVVEGGVIGGKELEHVIRSTATETQWKNGSKMEIALGGTSEQANGPRVPRLHRDETELMQDDTYKQAGNIPAGRKSRDGRYMPAQIVDTSTMKWAGGRVDLAIREYRKAIQQGVRPNMEVRISCVYEAAAENPACRSVPEEERRARLTELGRDPNELCSCDTYVSDVWLSEDPDKDPVPRTLESVCQGRFFRSRGFKQFDDIQTLFLENDRATWESEQECSQPSGEGVYIKSYSQTIHGIRGYEPDPENGTIYTGTDWGADDEHAHLWFQLLDRDVSSQSYSGQATKIMRAGSLVAFGEIFRAGIGNVALGEMVIAREFEWMAKYPGWRVFERYPDSANLGARLDWKDHLGLITTSRIKKDFKEEVKYIRSRVGNMRFYIDIPQCPNFDESIRSWRAVEGREVHNSASHCMAAFRYLEHNLQVIERARSKQKHVEPQPVAAGDQEERVRARESELAVGTVQIKRNISEEELLPIGGAAESPLRSQGSTMRSEGDWRQNFMGGEDY